MRLVILIRRTGGQAITIVTEVASQQVTVIVVTRLGQIGGIPVFGRLTIHDVHQISGQRLGIHALGVEADLIPTGDVND